MENDEEKRMEDIIRQDGRYPPEAYGFLHEGLSYAIQKTHGDEAGKAGQQKHVTGKQLCLGLRDLAVERWGLLAKAVLERWNIRATIDFGNMVYLLVDSKFMRKTEEDSLEDFRDVYDFQTAFDLADDFELKE